MAHRLHGGKTFLIRGPCATNRRAVLANYLVGTGIAVREVEYDSQTGMLDLAKLREAVSSDVCGVYVENRTSSVASKNNSKRFGATKGILIVGVNPIAQAVVRPPGEFGADIVIGEGQPLARR